MVNNNLFKLRSAHVFGFLLVLAVVVTLTGCSKGDGEAEATATADAASGSTGLSLTAAAAPASGAGEAAQKPAEPVVQFEAASRTTTEAGQQISDLDLLNMALEHYVEARSSNIRVTGNFQSEAEQMAAEAKAYEAARKPVTDLQQLVAAGVIRSIPQAPAGKKFAIDAKTGKVVLVDK